jgi:MFS superfamily sulfate permease-like transporter
MAAMTEQNRPRRSATESLLSIVLGLDALLVFFVMMTAFGLEVLPPAVAFGGGIALILVFALTGRVVSKPWGVWLGHALQLVLIALGFMLTAMFLIGVLFAAIWAYCFVAGRRLDRRNARFEAEASGAPDQQQPPNNQEQQ